MSFWKVEGATIDGSEDNSFAGSFAIIPDGTTAPATIKKFDYKDNVYIVTYKLVDGDFKGREVRQTIKAFDADEKKQVRAKNMLMRIMKICKYMPTHNDAPTAHEVSMMQGNVLGIKVQEWNMVKEDGSIAEGNWVSEAWPPSADFVTKSGTRVEQSVTRQSAVESARSRNPRKVDDSLELDIPF